MGFDGEKGVGESLAKKGGIRRTRPKVAGVSAKTRLNATQVAQQPEGAGIIGTYRLIRLVL